MMRRRVSPYSYLEAVRRSRREVGQLIGATVLLGLLLGVISDALGQLLRTYLSPTAQTVALVGGILLAIALVVWLLISLYAHGRSQRVGVALWIPYRLEPTGKISVPQRRSYQVTVHAQRALRHLMKQESAREEELARAWREARQRGEPLQDVLAGEHVALAQCLVLYVLHRYGDATLGPEAPYGWWGVSLPRVALTMDDLPPSVRENPYLRADQPPDWRLWWPRDVIWEVVPEPDNPSPRWRFRHTRYGYVELRWQPQLLGGKRGQVWNILTERLSLPEEKKREQVFLVGARLEAMAYLRWAILRDSEPFQNWATGLLAALEEALDWDYFLVNRPARLVADLAWKVGWVQRGSSLADMLQEVLGRLERLEVEQAMKALPIEEEGNPLVV